MSERLFLVLLVIITVLGSVWLSLIAPIVNTELILAVSLGLLGLVTVANIGNAKSGVLLPLFFIAAMADELYVYLNNPLGYILGSIFLLSVVGLLLSFSVGSVKSENATETATVEAKPVAKKASKKKKATSRKKR